MRSLQEKSAPFFVMEGLSMGRSPRRRQPRLHKKLLRIRKGLRLSQSQMVTRLEVENEFGRNAVSNFERGLREPSLYVLLRYARAAGICMDVLVDDEQDLPAKLPATPEHSGPGRK